jgi:hypothetical protein
MSGTGDGFWVLWPYGTSAMIGISFFQKLHAGFLA